MRRNAADEQHRMTGTKDAFVSGTAVEQHDDDEITMCTLAGMDATMRNLRVGVVSEDPVHLDDFEESDDDDATDDSRGCAME